MGEEFELAVTIRVNLDEAETIETLLTDNDEHHLAAHVQWCISNAKQNAGLLQPVTVNRVRDSIPSEKETTYVQLRNPNN